MNNNPNDSFNSEQEQFWAGKFGDDYIDRNSSPELLASNLALFTRILKHTSSITSIIEVGANVGLNLLALRRLLPNAQYSAVEINKRACSVLSQTFPECAVHNTSLIDFKIDKQADLALVKGVLIHQDPAQLGAVYDKLNLATRRYLVMAEYYSPTPVALEYRGFSGKLFKRDFAGEFLDRYPDFNLVDYGFVWKRDSQFPQDDLNWFLLGRNGN